MSENQFKRLINENFVLYVATFKLYMQKLYEIQDWGFLK